MTQFIDERTKIGNYDQFLAVIGMSRKWAAKSLISDDDHIVFEMCSERPYLGAVNNG